MLQREKHASSLLNSYLRPCNRYHIIIVHKLATLEQKTNFLRTVKKNNWQKNHNLTRLIDQLINQGL